MPEPAPTRRAEQAAATRAAIVDAARELFAERGYSATTVDEVARRARVTPKTVYTVTGGKRGLLERTTEGWVDAPSVDDGLERMTSMTDAGEVLALLAETAGRLWEEQRDVIRVVSEAAVRDRYAADAQDRITARIRRNLERVAVHLDRIGAVRDGLSRRRCTDVLVFHFGPQAFGLLRDELGWDRRRAHDWLVAQALAALRG